MANTGQYNETSTHLMQAVYCLRQSERGCNGVPKIRSKLAGVCFPQVGVAEVLGQRPLVDEALAEARPRSAPRPRHHGQLAGLPHQVGVTSVTWK